MDASGAGDMELSDDEVGATEPTKPPGGLHAGSVLASHAAFAASEATAIVWRARARTAQSCGGQLWCATQAVVATSKDVIIIGHKAL